MAGAAGLRVNRNPSDRRSGGTCFRQLSEGVGSWRTCARHRAGYFTQNVSIELKGVLRTPRAGELQTYRVDNTYKNIRSVRALISACGRQLQAFATVGNGGGPRPCTFVTR